MVTNLGIYKLYKMNSYRTAPGDSFNKSVTGKPKACAQEMLRIIQLCVVINNK